MRRMTCGGGPTKMRLLLAHISAKTGFSARNP
jgi:hypothetical protein